MAKKTPLRQCIGCGEAKAKNQMLRIIRSAEGEMSLDITGRKNGRGAYICYSEDCLKKAIKTKAIDCAFKIKIPDVIYENLGEELKRIESKYK